MKINTKLWGLQKSLLIKIYDGDYQPLVPLPFIQDEDGYASRKIKGGRLDVDKANTLLNELELKNEQAINELSKVMPTVPKIAKRKKPKLPFKQDGSLSVAGERWKVLAEVMDLLLSTTMR